ncbi:hypothetical protein BJY04DRAFT_180356 [Aspergillus karnatakaensis]|uniref:uncharacterized protein n=1 Tax=Aspergillus karnatakaensis TaxID=1810916 RepID=UPI003CCCEB5E
MILALGFLTCMREVLGSIPSSGLYFSFLFDFSLLFARVPTYHLVFCRKLHANFDISYLFPRSLCPRSLTLLPTM